MGIKDKVKVSKKAKVLVFIYFIFNFFRSNFSTSKVDVDTLAGSVDFGMACSMIDLIISIFFIIGWVYFFLKEYKLASTLIFICGVMNIIFALMSIETSNFSLYNVILIINIILSLGVVFSLRPKI